MLVQDRFFITTALNYEFSNISSIISLFQLQMRFRMKYPETNDSIQN